MKYVSMVLVQFAVYLVFKLLLDAPVWGALIAGYVFWICVAPKDWK